MALYTVGSRRLLAVTLLDYLVLQSAWQCCDALFLCVLGKELLAGIPVYSVCLFGEFLKVFIYDLLCLGVGQFGLVA